MTGRLTETRDVAAAARRMIRAIGERVASEDPEDLEQLLVLERALRDAWNTAIDGLRTHQFTDREIANALGVTKQAVQSRWPRS